MIHRTSYFIDLYKKRHPNEFDFDEYEDFFNKLSHPTEKGGAE